ncbi:unnamed protein product [Brassicogethes aeneus]|uniref:Uncharacterized protein n=1 Tax=Brassicogethes aeneus TaxID=1431903 RepID=A0A9P0FD82_BRAAE|nr:unnamed protein product [Brassicogethes aeneus]
MEQIIVKREAEEGNILMNYYVPSTPATQEMPSSSGIDIKQEIEEELDDVDNSMEYVDSVVKEESKLFTDEEYEFDGAEQDKRKFEAEDEALLGKGIKMPRKKLTKEEMLEKKRTAERLRYEKIKNDPRKLAAAKEKRKEKYAKLREAGKKKLVSEISKTHDSDKESVNSDHEDGMEDFSWDIKEEVLDIDFSDEDDKTTSLNGDEEKDEDEEMFETKIEVEYHGVEYDEKNSPSSEGVERNPSAKTIRARRTHVCSFCGSSVTNFSRHLIRNHSDELRVQEVLSLDKKSSKRKKLLDKIRREGDFSSSEIVPVMRKERDVNSYIVCTFCKGYYSKRSLRSHAKRCYFNPDPSLRFNALIEGQTFMAGPFNSQDPLKQTGLLSVLKADEISLMAKKDPIICEVARRYLKSHKDKDFLLVAKRHMRRLAQLLLNLRKLEGNPQLTLIDVLAPEKFQSLVKATLNMAEYNEARHTFKSPSLALQMGPLIKNAIRTAYSREVRKAPSCEVRLKNLKSLMTLIESDWTRVISSRAWLDMAISKLNKLPAAPVAEDVDKLVVEDAASNISQTKNTKKGSKRTLVPWTEEQKKLTVDFFKDHIRKRKAPKKHEVINLIETHPSVFQQKTWPVIKVYVCNKFGKIKIHGIEDQPKQIEITKSDDIADTKNTENGPKRVLVQWSEEQKKLTDDFLKVHIKEPNQPNIDETLVTFGKVVGTSPVKTGEIKNLRTKKSGCPYCKQDVSHFPRHLRRKHSEVGAIKELFAMPPNDPKRKRILNALRREGNFTTTANTNYIRPIRRPNFVPEDLKQLKEDYVACKDCLGYYKRNNFWRHRRKCGSELPKRERHLSTAQLFLICSAGVHSDFYATLRLTNEVFPIMRNDAISGRAMNDILVCCYAEELLKKHKGAHIKNSVSNKMRELGRLLLCLEDMTGLQKLFDFLKPQFFSTFVDATKVISGYDPESGSFKTFSLPLHMGTSLKQVCDVATTMVMEKSPLFSCANHEETLNEIKSLEKLIKTSWNCEISSLTSTNINKTKLAEDVMKFRKLSDPESPHDDGMEEVIDSTIGQNNENNNDVMDEVPPQRNENLIVKTKTNHSNHLHVDVDKKSTTRLRWTEQQKKLIKSHFKNHIKYKIAPRKKETEEFIAQFKDIFKDRNWVIVKAYVYNCYK